jgi:RNA polymerase sigma-70 factor, ECF subfamily
MQLHGTDDLEQRIRSLCEASDHRVAAAVAVRGYGPAILGFLVALHRSEQDAGEAFSMFTEDLWRGLAKFAWQCSFRTWAYQIARNASHRFKKSARRRAARDVPLDGFSGLEELQAEVRTETLSYLRTQNRSRLAELRDALPDEEKELLILRVDRRLPWADLARVMQGEDAGELSPEALKREAARLRKRFQLVKQKLLAALGREGHKLAGDD